MVTATQSQRGDVLTAEGDRRACGTGAHIVKGLNGFVPSTHGPADLFSSAGSSLGRRWSRSVRVIDPYRTNIAAAQLAIDSKVVRGHAPAVRSAPLPEWLNRRGGFGPTSFPLFQGSTAADLLSWLFPLSFMTSLLATFANFAPESSSKGLTDQLAAAALNCRQFSGKHRHARLTGSMHTLWSDRIRKPKFAAR
jgi:hypothetical protein